MVSRVNALDHVARFATTVAVAMVVLVNLAQVLGAGIHSVSVNWVSLACGMVIAFGSTAHRAVGAAIARRRHSREITGALRG